jgi:5-methylcytosine-specific restriction endonuclease McrA
VIPKPCIKCHRLTSGSYCRSCKPWPKSPGRLRGSQGQKLRKTMLEAFGYKCAGCGRSDVRLQVHHIDHNHRNNDMSNLIPLCASCHAKAGLRLI